MSRLARPNPIPIPLVHGRSEVSRRAKLNPKPKPNPTRCHRRTDRQTGRQTDRQADRQTDRQTGRQTGRMHACPSYYPVVKPAKQPKQPTNQPTSSSAQHTSCTRPHPHITHLLLADLPVLGRLEGGEVDEVDGRGAVRRPPGQDDQEGGHLGGVGGLIGMIG